MEYKHLAAMLDELIDEVGEDESNPPASWMDPFPYLLRIIKTFVFGN